MANKQLINGKVYDWSSVTITASGMENMEPMEISYDDEQESEPIYGRGGKIRGYGTGNQKNSVKLSLLREDFNEMCRVIQSKGYTTKQAYSFGVEHTREFRVIWHEEHNLIFLDGTWSLDGSKIIDAWQKTEVL